MLTRRGAAGNAMLLAWGLFWGVHAGADIRGGAYLDVSPEEAFELIRENPSDRDFVILDVRTPEEYRSGHVAGSVLLDYHSESFRHRLETLDRGKAYLVYCRTGSRSRRAIDIMVGLGFGRVYHMTGGIVRWRQKGMPVTR